MGAVPVSCSVMEREFVQVGACTHWEVAPVSAKGHLGCLRALVFALLFS